MSSALEAVAFVLRHQQKPRALKDLAHAVSSFLGPPPDLSINRACSRGSTKLLEWIWDSSCPSAASRPSNWALANFLRSDGHYKRYQFSKSVEVAASRNDLVTLKWLFTGCQAPKEVAAAAAGHGNVPMLQFLWKNDAGRLDSLSDRGESTSINNRQEMERSVETTEELIYSGNVVDWRRLGIRPHQCADVARWIREHLVCHVGERDRENAIIGALQFCDEELAKCLIPRGKCVLDYAAGCSCVEMVELLLDCGYIPRDRELASRMIQKLAGAGRLDLMLQIVLLHSPLPEGKTLCFEAWYNAMVAASWAGRVATLKWLVEHPMGQTICDYIKIRRNLFSFVCIAGNTGQLEVMQYIYDLGVATEISGPHIMLYGCYPAWMLQDGQVVHRACAIPLARYSGFLRRHHGRKMRTPKHPGLFYEMGSADSAHSDQNHSNQVVTWWSQPRDAILRAAENGCLEMLQWLLLDFPDDCPEEAKDIAAAGGSLEVVQWLDANTSEGCTTDAMDKAAGSGHLDIVTWLHANRSEGCTTTAMDEAASMGRLDVAQWLHENRNEGCTTQAMDKAARNGHLTMVQWLHANRSEGCTANAMTVAVKFGHPTVATSLHSLPSTRPKCSGCDGGDIRDAALSAHQLRAPLHLPVCRGHSA